MQEATQRIFSIVKRSTIFSAGNFLNKVLLFLMVPLFAYQISPEDLSLLEILDPFEQFLFALLQVGIMNAFYKYYQQNQDPQFREKLVSTGFWFLLGITLIAVFILGIFAQQITTALVGTHPLAILCFYVMLGGLVIRMLNSFSYAYYQVYQKASAIVWWTILGTLLYGIVNIVGLVVLNGNIDVVFWARLFLLFPLFIAGFLFFKKELVWHFDVQLLQKMLVFSYPFVLIGASYLILNFFDRWMLQKLIDAEATGIYGLSYRFGMIPGMILVAPFLKAWQPAIYETADSDTREAVYKRILIYYSLAGCVLWLGLSVFSKELLLFFATEAYFDGHVIIPYIAASQFFYGLGWIVVAGMAYNERTLPIGIVTLVSALSNIVMNYYFIPIFGLIGAAYATLLAFLILFLGFLWYAHRTLGIQWPLVRISVLMMCSLLMYSAFFLLPDLSFWPMVFLKSLMLIPAIFVLFSVSGLGISKISSILSLISGKKLP